MIDLLQKFERRMKLSSSCTFVQLLFFIIILHRKCAAQKDATSNETAELSSQHSFDITSSAISAVGTSARNATSARVAPDSSTDPSTCSHITCKDPGAWCNNIKRDTPCPCKPGYYRTSEDDACAFGLTFGGRLHVKERPKYYQDIVDLLSLAFNTTDGFLDLDVFRFNSTSLTYDYKLFYKLSSATREELITGYFSVFIDSCCDDGGVCVCGKTFNVVIDEKPSIIDAGTVTTIPCEIEQAQDYCDKNTAVCTSQHGYTQCKCRDNYARMLYNERSCAPVVCSDNSHCNAPFGECDAAKDNGVGRCSCIFGFEGMHCYSPWLFVLLIVGSFLFLLVLILITVICVSSPAPKKKNAVGQTPMNAWKDHVKKPIRTHSIVYNPPYELSDATNTIMEKDTPEKFKTSAQSVCSWNVFETRA